MKTIIEVPCARPQGKEAKLTLDHASGEVEIVLPATMRTPRIHLEDLEIATRKLRGNGGVRA